MAGAEKRWWGQRALEASASVTTRIGPLAIHFSRPDGQWQLAWKVVASVFDNTVGDRELGEEPELIAPELSRLAVRAKAIEILPASADRPLVTRAAECFLLPPGATETIFVGAPLWFQVCLVGEGLTLIDEPIARPSDTWFGPPTDEGELCYASHTLFRRDPAQLPVRPHRSLTRVRLENQSSSVLSIDRLRLPVQHLSLFLGDDGRLWTEDIELVATRGDDFANVNIDDGPPLDLDRDARIARPRRSTPKGFAIRAFGGLLARSRELVS